jgi:hypothetical protein
MVTLHCAIEKNSVSKSKSINSTEDLVHMYPQQFDRIGHFPGQYRIVLDPGIPPVIHAPRKCPINLRDELKSEPERMKKDGVIRKVDEPTEWVNSLAYSRKASGQLRIFIIALPHWKSSHTSLVEPSTSAN